jgi:1,4-dihydroxy-2-naphthoyl-CoA hydrolase
MGSSDKHRSIESVGGDSVAGERAAGAPLGPEDSPGVEPAVAPVAAAMLSQLAPQGWIHGLGLQFLRATAQEVVAEWTIDAGQLQPHGIVHGGVYTTVVETCCSVGASVAAPRGKLIVGVENHTSFVRAVRSGRLQARATPLHAGRRAQLWECNITDAAERLIATGRLRVMCVDAEAGQER